MIALEIRLLPWWIWMMVVLATASCSSGGPQVGSQTNWLKVCDSSADCGDLTCLCGTCTAQCEQQDDCSDAGLGSCIRRAEVGAVAVCDGQPPSTGLCLARCGVDSCAEGSKCVAEVCVPAVAPTARISVDPSVQHQALIGFGASLAYDEDAIAGHPAKEALLDALFTDAGFEIIRIRNRFDGGNAGELDVAAELIAEAAARLGAQPTIYLSSNSPPASLKANGNLFCSNSDVTCTLSRNMGGAFDYAGFAQHWRASLQAYEQAGIRPDYVSIQNGPDWLPPGPSGLEACRFLPEQGTTSVTLPDGSTVDAEFPGYVEALDAVIAATTADGPYAFVAPEVGSVVMMSSYVAPLDPSTVEALTVHFYTTDPAAPDLPLLESLATLGSDFQKPVMQSEMQAGGLDTALLVHQAVTTGGAAAYLHLQFVAPPDLDEKLALVSLDTGTFETRPNYHALAHYARGTEAGWLRVDAVSDADALLSSAWVSAGGDALTVVLVNSGLEAVDAEVDVPALASALLDTAQVARTTFDGSERSVLLGPLPADHVVRLPAHSVVTVSSFRP